MCPAKSRSETITQLPITASSKFGEGEGASKALSRLIGAGFKAISKVDLLALSSEAFLVIDGVMNLTFKGKALQVSAGEVYVVPAGVPHGVAHRSQGTLVIIDCDSNPLR